MTKNTELCTKARVDETSFSQGCNKTENSGEWPNTLTFNKVGVKFGKKTPDYLNSFTYFFQKLGDSKCPHSSILRPRQLLMGTTELSRIFKVTNLTKKN